MSDQDLIVIDGREGEGGGQVLRTSVALAVALGRPVRIEHIRANRKSPGLKRQHLTAVRAALEVAGGDDAVGHSGVALGSAAVELWPAAGGRVHAGSYRFAVGSAGSTTLVLQTVLAPLLLADGPSDLLLEGGTHNPLAPSFDFVARSFAPQVARMGGRLELTLERHGFAPAGGGRMRVRIEPAAAPVAFELLQRGEARRPRVEIALAGVPGGVAAREWAALQRKTHWPDTCCNVREVTDSAGPGNVVSVELESDHVTAVFTAFGAKGVRSERIGGLVARDVQRYLASDAPVCEHLADQLMLPMALLAGGRYRTTRLTSHARTNAQVIERFLPGAVTVGDDGIVTVRGRRMP